MRLQDTITTIVRRQQADGSAAVGKAAGDFGFNYRVNGTAVAAAITVTEGVTIGPVGNQWREYALQFALPNTAGIHDLTALANTGTDVVWPNNPLNRDVEAYDLDAIAAAVIRPIVTLTEQGAPQGDITLRLPKGDYAPISLSVQDASGNPIDVSGWNNAKFGVRSDDGTTTTYELDSGITLGDGVVTWAIPETASFYAALADGKSEVRLNWSLVADQDSESAKTRTLGRGQLVVIRREVS